MTTTQTATPAHATKPGPGRGARIFGYLLGSGIQLLILWLVLVSPGWRAVPFVTDAAGQVVGLFTVSVLVGLLINAVLLAYDPRALRRLGDAVNAALALVVTLRVLDVFPFDFGQHPGWATVVRVLLILAAVGAGIGVIANLVQAVRRR
ncbi:MAG TPA: hypothetical protein VM307_00625 [Egibacteraceae bacterium]|nr:hypothetical protein [Egibacteraceae bacterium]